MRDPQAGEDGLEGARGERRAVVGPERQRPARDRSLGAKRWDAYVVLLASEDAEKRGTPDVLSLEY